MARLSSGSGTVRSDSYPSVIDKLTAPPSSPNANDSYIIIATATGAWAGKEDQIASYSGSAWQYAIPTVGAVYFVTNDEELVTYDGTDWLVTGSAAGSAGEFSLTGLDTAGAKQAMTGANARLLTDEIGVGATTTAATATATCVSAAADNYDSATLTLVDAAGTSKTYVFDDDDGGDTGTLDSTNIRVQLSGLSGAASVATELQRAIESSNGHNGTILVSRSAGVLTLSQATHGTAGNQTNSTSAGGSTFTITSFTGGANLARTAHIVASDENAPLLVENTASGGYSTIGLRTSHSTDVNYTVGTKQSDGSFGIWNNASPGTTPRLTIDSSGKVTIPGDLQIDGTTTTINSTTLTVDDKTVVIASGAADSAAADGAGISVDGASASILYDHTGTQWEMNKPLEVTGNITSTGDIILDDGGSLKEAGGTAAFTFDGSGNVTKIGVSTQTSGHFLKYDGSKYLLAAVSGEVAGGVAADDINGGDAAVSIATSSGNITIDAQANDADVIIKVDDGGTSRTAVTFDGSENAKAMFYADINVPGEVQTTGIGYTDGDNALTIADGGGVTAAAGLTSTAAANTFGATSFNGAAITNVASIFATDLKFGEDDQTKIDFETADEIHIFAANQQQFNIVDGGIVPNTDNDIDLGTSSKQFKDAYFHGTVETDALTIGGVTLSETIADTVGAMVGSNTETGIAVTYEDSDNTLDFVLAAAQTGITSLLATDIKIGEDDQTKIDFEDADHINFYADNTKRVSVHDTGMTIHSGSLETATIDYTDGDNAITIADGGAITVAQAMTASNGITSTGATNTFGATSFNDANVTNVGDIALDSISADGTDINVAVSDNSATALTIKQGSDAYLIIDTANSSESVSIGTGISGTAISIGHSSSETTVNDNLTVTGDLTVNGTTTTINSTTLTVDDKVVVIASGAADSAAADGAGISVDGASATILYDHTGTQWEMNKPLEVSGTFKVSATDADTTSGVMALFEGIDGNTDEVNRISINANSANADSGISFLDNSSTKWTIGNDGSTDEFHMRVGYGVYAVTDEFVLSSAGKLTLLDDTTSSGTTGAAIRLVANDGQVMADNHRLGVIEFAGAEDTNNTISVGARIQAICRADWDGSNNDADLEFYTTDGTTESLVLTLDADKLATFTGGVNASATTASTSATTGALITGGGLGVAADAYVGDDVYLISDAAVLGFGADKDVTLTHVADTGLLLNSDHQLQFRDSAIYINSDADGYMNVRADTGVNINVNGTDELAITGSTATFGTNIVIPDDGTIGSASDTDAIAIASDGLVTFSAGDIEFGNAQNGALMVAATAHNAAGKTLTLSSGSTTAGTTNNIAGGNLILQGGQGKGTGVGGEVVFQVAAAGGSGSSLNSYATIASVDDAGIDIASGKHLMFNDEDCLTETALVLNPGCANTGTDNVTIKMITGEGSGGNNTNYWLWTSDADGGISSAGSFEPALLLDYNDGSSTHNFLKIISEDQHGGRYIQALQELNIDASITFHAEAKSSISYGSNATTLEIKTAGEKFKVQGTGETLAEFIDDTGCVFYDDNGTQAFATTADASWAGIEVGDGGTAGMVHSKGNHDLKLQTGNSTTGSITITDGANGDIALSPNGSGMVEVDGDIHLKNDGDKIIFGASDDVTLTHHHEHGLKLKNAGSTGDDSPVVLTLQSGETDLAQDDVIAKIAFQAPDEGEGTDAVLVAGAIQAVAEGDFSASSNATRLEFMTGSSEAATAKMELSSGGVLTVDQPSGDAVMKFAENGTVKWHFGYDDARSDEHGAGCFVIAAGANGYEQNNDAIIIDPSSLKTTIQATVQVGPGNAQGILQSSGDHDLKLQTGNSTTGNITITDGANGDISLNPNGSGKVEVAGEFEVNTATATAAGAGVGRAAILETYVAKINGEIVTTILIDVTGLTNGGAVKHVLADTGEDANGYLTQLTTAINGSVYKVEMSCIETPEKDGTDSAKVSLAFSDVATQGDGETYDGAGNAVLVIDGTQNNWSPGMSLTNEGDVDLTNQGRYASGGQYVYLAAGENSDDDVMTGGKFIIKFYGANF